MGRSNPSQDGCRLHRCIQSHRSPDDAAVNACLPQDWPICSNCSVVVSAAAHSIDILRNNGWSVFGKANQSTSSSLCYKHLCPKPGQRDHLRYRFRIVHAKQVAHDDVRARERSDAGLVQCWQRCGFHIAVLVKLVISIGCIAAPMEILPATVPALTARPSASANSFETSKFPPVMLSNCALAS